MCARDYTVRSIRIGRTRGETHERLEPTRPVEDWHGGARRRSRNAAAVRRAAGEFGLCRRDGAGRSPPGTPVARFRLAFPLRPRQRFHQGFQLRPLGNVFQNGEFHCSRPCELRRWRLESGGPAARLGCRVALPKRSGAAEPRLLPHGPELSRDQYRLVPPRFRTPGRGRGQAALDRIRRRLPPRHGDLQQLLHRRAPKRLCAIPLRCDGLRRARRSQRAAGARGRHARATAGSTKARASTATSGW